MRVNRLGKVILESYSGLKEFIAKNDLKVNFRTLYGWCTEYTSTPNLKNYIHIDAVAKALEVSRQSVLDMIATKAVYEVEPKKELPMRSYNNADNLFKKTRRLVGLSPAELASRIGCEKQIIYDIENGKRVTFPNSDMLKKYLEVMNLSFTQFQHEVNALREKVKPKERESSAKSREAKRSEIIDMIYGGYDEEAIEKRDKVMEEFNNEYEVTHMGNEAIITPREDKCIENPHKEKNPLLPAEDMQKVMSLLYGKVNFNTFKQIENILMGGEQ